MDILRQPLVDAGRARDVFRNTHKRIRAEKRKTDEKYLKILIDEVNKYFAFYDVSRIDSDDLPSKRSGPSSEKQNKIVDSFVKDVDGLHGKQKTVAELITKSVNYMSNEREGVTESISKLHSKIISHKLRTSINNENAIIFNEYFNDYGMTDLQKSDGIEVDPGRSTLTLEAKYRNFDNSNLIDPTSIKLTVDVDEELNDIYPICNKIDSDNDYRSGYGETLPKIESEDVNVKNASDGLGMRFPEFKNTDPARVSDIQKQMLKANNDTNNTGEFSIGMFELIMNDLSSVTSPNNDLGIMHAVKSSIPVIGTGIDNRHFMFDDTYGYSLSGANTANRQTESFRKIKRLNLKFKINDSSTFSGNVSKIVLTFATPSPLRGGFIPKIDPINSTIDGEHLFVDEIDSKKNGIVEKRVLTLNTAKTNPKEFVISMIIEGDGSQVWAELESYIGAYWEFKFDSNDIEGAAEINGTTLESLGTSATRVFYVYHDKRKGQNLTRENLPIAKLVAKAQSSKISEES